MPHDPTEYDIQPSREERVAEIAARRALEEFSKTHICRFQDKEAKILHALSDVDGGLDIETASFIIRAAKIVNGAVNSMARYMVLTGFLIVLLVLAFLAKKCEWKPF